MPICAVHLGDARGVGRVFRSGHRQVGGLAVDRPLLELDAHHRQGEHRGHDVGEVVDEVDAARLDLLVEGRPGDLVDERLPPLDRGGGQVGVQRTAVGAVLGFVHLQDAAAHDRGPLRLRDRDALVPAALSVDVVIVGHDRTARQFEDVLAVRGDPVPVVDVGPGHRALGLHLLGDLLELQPVLRGVPVEVVPILLPLAVGGSLRMSSTCSRLVSLCFPGDAAASVF